MASPVLHIKDSFYFEVPKGLYPIHLTSKQQFTGAYDTWLRLDPQFQEWEANRFYDEYAKLHTAPANKQELIAKYLSWKDEKEANAGKPFWRFLQESGDRQWFQERAESSQFRQQWHDAIEKTSGHEALAAFRSDASAQWDWSSEKLANYSRHLSGKILIPQPFARLRNLYEKEWGVGISRFMIIEVAVALLLWALFSWLGRQVGQGDKPRGALWNLLEMLVMFVRDEIARPVIGHEAPLPVATATSPMIPGGHGHSTSHGAAGHGVTGHGAKGHDGHDHDGHGHGVAQVRPGAAAHGPDTQASHEHGEHGHGGHEEHHHDPRFDADRFVPLLLTIFFFVLGCNLAGMLPWVGSPTAEWGTTSAIAIVTFATGILYGIRRFGVVGYLINQVPQMDVPMVMAVVLKPMIFAIEILGLCIKHSILSIRLLANMVAGHIVLVSIMALAFSIQGAASDSWYLTSIISVVGSVLLSCLELFVAFLQAYIFTFLSAMFIGAAFHSH